MKKVICDTNIFIHYFNGDTTTSGEVKRIGLKDVILPSVAAMELFRGMKNKNQMAWMKKRLKDFNLLHIDVPVSEKALEFIEAYRLSQDLKLPDAFIGAMAVVYQIPLFTYNVKDFKYLPGIILYKKDESG
ncbi:MAG: type II toxin-antitoxin system VapC family toxin [Saprospiraceae bacterium]|nr:MAG: type II toxin-antitoxin system VapC family toxin [Saprospiraceae bacterium]